MRSPLEKSEKEKKKRQETERQPKSERKARKKLEQSSGMEDKHACNCCPSCSRDEGGTDMLFLTFYIFPTTTELLIVQVLFMSIDVH